MAMSMSIANLNRSIRAHFDERIDRIQRNMQLEYANRSIGQANEGQQVAESDMSNNSSSERNAREGICNTITPMQQTGNPESSEDRTTDIDGAGRPNDHENDIETRLQITRTDSMELTVEYDELAADSESVAEDSQGESGDTLDREIRSISEDGERRLSCCEFYRKHWVGNLVTGLFSGFLFILLGVIFLVNGDDFPFYAGIMLIVLGLAPCCMALNRYRYARLYERERRTALRRLNALRRAHRRNLREERQRQIYSDLPPSYDNLGFELGETDIEMDNISVATSGSFVLPTYDQFVKKDKEKLDKLSKKKKKSASVKNDWQEREDRTEPPPNYSESMNVVTGPESSDGQREFVEIVMPPDRIEIMETRHSYSSTHNPVDNDETAPSSDNLSDVSVNTVEIENIGHGPMPDENDHISVNDAASPEQDHPTMTTSNNFESHGQ